MSSLIEYTEPYWRGLDMRKLKVDEAYLVANTFYHKVTYLYSLSDECHTCPYKKVKAIHEHNNNNITSASVNINVAYGLKFKLLADDVGPYDLNNKTSLCNLHIPTNLREFGVYKLTLYGDGNCIWGVDKNGVNVNLSLLSVFMLVGLILCVLKISLCAWRSYRYDEVLANAEVNEAATTSQPTVQKRKRMRSLDTFRGMSIVLMIFVNSGGGNYWWIEHAPWNGLHLADIVFPSFLWIMGVCIPISIKSQLARGTNKLRICLRIIWRSTKLFLIGLCLNSINGPNLEDLRIMGVLQRFGIAYLICGVAHTAFTQKEHIELQDSAKHCAFLALFKGEICLMLSLIIVHFSIVFGLYVPNCPIGYLGPGGIHYYASYRNCTGGVTGYIDLQILGDSHIYQHPSAKYIYDSKAFDPEGIFGCLLTVVQVLFGVLAGVIILVYTDWKSRITRWLLWSMLLTIITAILTDFSQESGIIPINKNLWSLSFVSVTTALAFIILSLLYYIIDIRQWWTGYPFEECGMNAIVMYVGHTIMHKMLPWHWRIGSMNTHFVLLLEALWNTMLWIGIALYLNHIQFYYSV